MNYELFAAAAQDNGGWFDNPTPWLALFGTLFGGVLIKFADSWLNNPKKRDSTPAELREELRQQVQGLKEDVNQREEVISEVRAEMNLYREKYWALVSEHSKIQRQMLDYLSEIQQLQSEIEADNGDRK